MKHSLGLLTCLLLAPLALLQCEDKRPQKLSEAEARQYREAAEYSRSAHGVAVLVMRRGEIVFEDYAPGWQDKPHELASGTKSFAGVMAGPLLSVQVGMGEQILILTFVVVVIGGKKWEQILCFYYFSTTLRADEN